MGVAAKSYVRVEFEQGTPIELSSATSVEQEMLKHYYKNNPEAVGKPSITIVDFNLYPQEIQLEFYSTRRQNLDFQVNLFQDYVNDNYSDELVEINEDTWVQG